MLTWRAWQVGKYKPGEPEDFSAERVTKSVHESLERLGLEYIDLIHCHDIESVVDMKQVCSRCPSSAGTCYHALIHWQPGSNKHKGRTQWLKQSPGPAAEASSVPCVSRHQSECRALCRS